MPERRSGDFQLGLRNLRGSDLLKHLFGERRAVSASTGDAETASEIG